MARSLPIHSLALLTAAAWLMASGCGAPNPPAANGPPVAAAKAAAPAAEWKLTAEQEKLLGAAVTVGGLEVRAPADFRDMGQRGPGHIWVGTPRPDETYPTATLISAPLPPDSANLPLEALLAESMKGVRGARKDFTESPPERGTIQGLPFIRCKWSGGPGAGARAGLQGKTFHGIVYLGVHQGSAIQFLAQDTAPDHPRSLELLEAMAYSLRAKAAP